jgi:type I restriction enzyme S subunit
MGSVIQIRPDSVTHPSWLVHVLQLESSQSELLRTSGSSAQQAIYLAHIKKMCLPVPPMEEQKAIGATLDALQCRINGESKVRSSLLSQKTSLMQDLLTGKVRVNVDEAEEVTSDV